MRWKTGTLRALFWSWALQNLHHTVERERFSGLFRKFKLCFAWQPQLQNTWQALELMQLRDFRFQPPLGRSKPWFILNDNWPDVVARRFGEIRPNMYPQGAPRIYRLGAGNMSMLSSPCSLALDEKPPSKIGEETVSKPRPDNWYQGTAQQSRSHRWRWCTSHLPSKTEIETKRCFKIARGGRSRKPPFAGHSLEQ